jgi:hypothetical protein
MNQVAHHRPQVALPAPAREIPGLITHRRPRLVVVSDARQTNGQVEVPQPLSQPRRSPKPPHELLTM